MNQERLCHQELKFIIKEKYKFIYSIHFRNSNLGLSHYFGLEISI